MHLGNNAVTPQCVAISWAITAPALGLAALAVRRSLNQLDSERAVSRLGVAATVGMAVFGAQMINVPILPWSSAHLVGGILLAWLAGPALGLLTMAAILAVQAFALGDGGTLALGTNILNMGVLPALAVAVVKPQLANRSATASMAGIAVVSFFTILGAAAMIVGEVAMYRSGDALTGLGVFTREVIGVHAMIAVGEAALTVAIIAAIGAIRGREWSLSWKPAAALATLGIAMILLAGAISSDKPDGYEASAERANMHWLLEG